MISSRKSYDSVAIFSPHTKKEKGKSSDKVIILKTLKRFTQEFVHCNETKILFKRFLSLPEIGTKHASRLQEQFL